MVDPQDVPSTESLKDTVDRLLPFWEETIAPAIQAGQQILIVASGNSIRVSIAAHSVHICKHPYSHKLYIDQLVLDIQLLTCHFDNSVAIEGLLKQGKGERSRI